MAAIVVIAYNRPHSLERLLNSLTNAVYPSHDQITLHISIDFSEETGVVEIANSFIWEHGKKVVQCQPQRLGLLKHVLLCGDLTEKYNELIVLEDDLVVAPDFYNYANQAINYYSNESEVAGISLFRYRCEENRFLPFVPLNDGSDVHFIQVASSWGQAWNRAQWNTFKEWLAKNERSQLNAIPAYMKQWGTNSWKRFFNCYLIETNRFFVFPSTSLSTNFEDEGTNASSTGLMQVPLQIGVRDYHFSAITDSSCIYDAYFELLPKCIKKSLPELENYNFDVDTYGAKPKDNAFDFRLTTRTGSDPIVEFGSTMVPLIANVLFKSTGNEIGLFPMNSIEFEDTIQHLRYHYPANDLSKIARHAMQFVSFSVVIPVIEGNSNQLMKTLNTLRVPTQVLEIIVVAAKGIEIDKIALKDQRVKLLRANDDNLSACLAQGFTKAGNEIVTWLHPGTELKSDALSTCAQIFTDFKTIHWVLGVEEHMIPRNRWSAKNALNEPDRSMKMSSEGTFFRREIVGKWSAYEAENSCYLLLSKTQLTVLAKLLIVTHHSNYSHQSSEFATKYLSHGEGPYGFFYAMLKPLIRARFFKNGTLFSLMYRRTEQLPFVLRYDEQNNSYYLNEY